MISYTPSREAAAAALTATAARLAAVGDIDQAREATPQAFGAVPVLQRLTPTSQAPGNACGLSPCSTAQQQTGFANRPGVLTPPDPIPVASQPGNPEPQPLGAGAYQPPAGGRWTRAGD